MKQFIILLFGVALLTSGCKKFLEEEPESFITGDNLFTSEAGAQAGLTAAYSTLKNFRNSGRAMLFGVVGTDEAQLGIDEAGVNDRLGLDAYDGNLNAQNPWVTQMWRVCFTGIGRANAVIESVPGITMAEATKKQIIAEARFLRALNYFWAVQLWGDLPLIDKVISNADQYNYPRRPQAEIYSFIIADLTAAEPDLPETFTGTNLGRATKGAVRTLLGKVFLSAPGAQRNYTNAAAKLLEVITSNRYSLLPNYADLFDVARENNAESIFEVQFLSPDQPNNMSFATGSRAIPDNVLGGGYAWFIPTDFHFNSYDLTDTRRAPTFRTEFFNAAGVRVTSSANAEHLKPHVRKFEDPVNRNLNGKNTYVLRYADVILMYAEALNESGRSAEAITELNKVRRRAGLTDVAGLNQATLRTAILDERRKELAFEGWRWYDLKRTGQLVALAGQHNPRARGRITANNNLMPIPLDEINNNEGINPEHQNPGY